MTIPDLASIPDKRGFSGQRPEKAGHLTRLNKWQTWEGVGRPTSIVLQNSSLAPCLEKLSGTLALYNLRNCHQIV